LQQAILDRKSRPDAHHLKIVVASFDRITNKTKNNVKMSTNIKNIYFKSVVTELNKACMPWYYKDVMRLWEEIGTTIMINASALRPILFPEPAPLPAGPISKSLSIIMVKCSSLDLVWVHCVNCKDIYLTYTSVCIEQLIWSFLD
jgi:hypothetical protein